MLNNPTVGAVGTGNALNADPIALMKQKEPQIMANVAAGRPLSGITPVTQDNGALWGKNRVFGPQGV